MPESKNPTMTVLMDVQMNSGNGTFWQPTGAFVDLGFIGNPQVLKDKDDHRRRFPYTGRVHSHLDRR